VTGAQYEIVIRGRLGGAFARWFDELEVRASGPDATYLRGWFPDQAALEGFLNQLGDLGLELLSVHHLTEPQRSRSDPAADGG